MIKNEMTRGRFVVIGVVVVSLCLIFYSWRGLVQSGEITAMMAMVIAYAGLLPFIIGFIVQLVFLKRAIPSYAAWALALAVVVLQWMISGKAPLMVMEQGAISIVVSLIITGMFVNLGLKATRAFFKRKVN
ncbi:MAG: hypothetical protein CXR31_08710 [Geobacter sp.]|nr:MAG: hypothetical protein CXR31_08710 [Geobacter sp.]